MFRLPTKLFLYIILSLIPLSASFQVLADEEEDAEKALEQQEAIQATIETLQTLLQTSREKSATVEKTLKELRKPDEELEQEETAKSLEELQTELDDLQLDLESIATGISIKEYRGKEPESFDLKLEVEKLLQPMIYALKSVTEDSRQIEHLRQSHEQVQQRSEVAIKAVANLELLINKTEDPDLKPILDTMLAAWLKEKESLENEDQVISHQLQSKLDSKDSMLSSTGEAFTGFFKSRGVNFILGLLAFIVVFFLLRLLFSLLRKVWIKRGIHKQSTFVRLANLIFQAFTFIASIMATLFVFNMRNDWLLLGLGVLFLMALGWVLIKTLPGMVEQIMMLLNLGSVREGERVVFNGVPWKVESLNFYTHFTNPDLTGGSFHLSIRELVGMVSRPSSSNEEWFPCKVGEWVELEEKEIGKVIYQSPDMVELENFGGSHQTYTTDDFLSLSPKNLSRNYRIQMVFGIDYKYQSICTTDIPGKMTVMLKENLLEIMDESEVLRVVVDFFQPNASSLDYEYEAFIKGTSAHLYEEVERTMIYSFTNACNKYGWEIPFQQITLHQTVASE